MFHLIQKTKEKKSRLRLFSGKCIVKSWKCWKRNVVGGLCETINCQFSTINSIKTRSDKSDLKQHSFLTAHFTAFFGYINEVAYLVESWKWTVDSFARATLNEQRSTLNTFNCHLSTLHWMRACRILSLSKPLLAANRYIFAFLSDGLVDLMDLLLERTKAVKVSR